jgi:hypothetical protein|tara:strand:- start:181 stop:321 length:141 start_codon:yes stop_codon:yes gene_type:complete
LNDYHENISLNRTTYTTHNGEKVKNTEKGQKGLTHPSWNDTMPGEI